MATVDKLVQQAFEVIERTDKAEELESSQFGYQSLHYILKIKESWLSMPSLKGLGGYVFELQLRTLAQHIWAVASHKLQYKREESVPSDLRRSINRVSALLEMVDLEFDRVLAERERYKSEPSNADSVLNVDLLASTLNLLLPMKNRDDDEPYDELLAELAGVDINTVGKLVDFMSDTAHYRDNAEAQRAAEDPVEDPEATWDRTIARHQRGVYFTHAGLVRISMDHKFGAEQMRALRRDVGWEFT